MIKKKTERLFWLDAVRVIAIFLVVLTHSVNMREFSNNQPAWIISTLYDTVARIGVPLFVLISGSLLLGKEESVFNFFIKRLNKVVIPWIFWALVYMLWTVFYLNYEVPNNNFLKYYIVIFLSQYWFLVMLAGLYILTPLIRTFIKHATKDLILYSLTVWFVLISFFPFSYGFFSSYSVLNNSYTIQHLGFFIAGYYLMRSLQKQKLSIVLSIFLLSIFLTVAARYNFTLSDQTSYANLFTYNVSPLVVISSISAFLALRIYFGSLKLNPKLQRVIILMSEASYGIFLVHVIIKETFDRVFNYEIYLHLDPILKAIVVFMISFMIVLLIKLIPLLKRIAE